MSLSKETDPGFPWFEEKNFSGWLIQMKSHLRKSNAHTVLDNPRETDRDANGQLIPLTVQQRTALTRRQERYDLLDNIAFSELMKACRLNPKTKSLCETGGFNTAYDLLIRLRQRFHNVDEVSKAAHLLRYHSLKQTEDETGADFVDRERKEFLALQDMGVNVDESLRLTKFIQQNTTNSRHQSLAQTIFSTPDMTLTRATSLFENYAPPETPSVPVNVIICKACKKKGHLAKDCRSKKKRLRGKGGKGNGKTSQEDDKPKRPRFPCPLCQSMEHSAYKCPQLEAAQKCVSQKPTAWENDNSEEDK